MFSSAQALRVAVAKSASTWGGQAGDLVGDQYEPAIDTYPRVAVATLFCSEQSPEFLQAFIKR